MNVKKYLDRLGIKPDPAHSLKFLTELQNSHMQKIPFENLDIHLNKKITMDVNQFYNKIIDERRGGFCYELNGLFGSLLIEMGFSVDFLSAQVFENGKYGREFDHLTLIVHLENDYLVDVGFGDSFRSPLLFPDGEVEDISGKYKLTIDENNAQTFYLLKSDNNEWKPQYTFSTIPRNLTEFAGMCEYHQTSPESSFTQKWICSAATAEGRISLSEKNLKVTNGGRKTITEINGKHEFCDLLNKHFNISINPDKLNDL
ncbi:MAG: arylamine N-acetyltransferase [Melioribacteraceae bacterium]|nr:arylamine N-acetyltransferase [Melioribacteraceae bacterium]MCF8356795.1 arylamine N-acetyltransferase [Melioribacteraceae bacterium]MCF8396175.1 arylamine N-acetyltransferase [Melioribacteraceae bacterium]MCF8421128.1 arylamine N-acetyltransferase [Melioribacteraceae bacterium]